MEHEYVCHQNNKKLARKRTKVDIKKAKSDPSIYVYHFDLQKILLTPKAAVSNLYYMCKLTVYNMTIYDLTSHSGICNVWNETNGQRGSNEIGSILMAHVKKKLKEDSRIKKIVFVSDNCSGQNKNQFIFSMLYFIAMRYNIQIVHR